MKYRIVTDGEAFCIQRYAPFVDKWIFVGSRTGHGILSKIYPYRFAYKTYARRAITRYKRHDREMKRSNTWEVVE